MEHPYDVYINAIPNGLWDAIAVIEHNFGFGSVEYLVRVGKSYRERVVHLSLTVPPEIAQQMEETLNQFGFDTAPIRTMHFSGVLGKTTAYIDAIKRPPEVTSTFYPHQS